MVHDSVHERPRCAQPNGANDSPWVTIAPFPPRRTVQATSRVPTNCNVDTADKDMLGSGGTAIDSTEIEWQCSG